MWYNGEMGSYKPLSAEQRAEHNRARYRANRQLINESKQGPCADCGVEYPPYVMDLDHRPGEVKLFQISKGLRKSRGVLLTEIAKCDTVCANCHRIRTHTRPDAYLPQYLIELRRARIDEGIEAGG